MSPVSRGIDRIGVTFDEPSLVADAGLIVPATLMVRLGLEALVNTMVHLGGRVGGSRPGRKVLTLVAAILAGGSATSTTPIASVPARPRRVLPFRVMAPSTLGTFLRAFTFGHIRQLDAVIAEAIRRAWSLGAGPGSSPMTMDLDSTICEVHGKSKQGAAYGYTSVLGYHPLVATWAETGEVLHARLRKGSSQRGHKRFVEELVARVRRAGASGALVLRADAGFFSYALIDTLGRLGVAYSVTVTINAQVRACIDAIDESAWRTIDYPDAGLAQVAETTYVSGRRGKRRALRPRRAPHSTGRPAQAALWPDWRHHAFVTDLAFDTVEADVFHREHAGSSSPSVTSKKEPGSSTAPRATSSPTRPGSACAVLAHNLIRWTCQARRRPSR